jgi:hypothetical protein
MISKTDLTRKLILSKLYPGKVMIPGKRSYFRCCGSFMLPNGSEVTRSKEMTTNLVLISSFNSAAEIFILLHQY